MAVNLAPTCTIRAFPRFRSTGNGIESLDALLYIIRMLGTSERERTNSIADIRAHAEHYSEIDVATRDLVPRGRVCR